MSRAINSPSPFTALSSHKESRRSREEVEKTSRIKYNCLCIFVNLMANFLWHFRKIKCEFYVHTHTHTKSAREETLESEFQYRLQNAGYQFGRLKPANLLWRHKNQNRQIFISKCIAERDAILVECRGMQGNAGESNAQDEHKNKKNL